MWGQVKGKNKIVIARETFAELVGELDARRRVGLVAYGHRREGDCSDIERLVEVSPLDRERLVATVNAVQPKGMTPLAASIGQALDQAINGAGSELADIVAAQRFEGVHLNALVLEQAEPVL